MYLQLFLGLSQCQFVDVEGVMVSFKKRRLNDEHGNTLLSLSYLFATHVMDFFGISISEYVTIGGIK